MEDIDYKKRCEEYEKRMGIGQDDPAKDGYLVLIGLLRQQNEYLKEVKIKPMIGSDDAAKKIEYKNAKELWEALPKMISAVSTLKSELKIDGVEATKPVQKPISPQSIAAAAKN